MTKNPLDRLNSVPLDFDWRCTAQGCDSRGTWYKCNGRFCTHHARELAIIRRRIKRAQADKLLNVEIQARRAENELRGSSDHGHLYRIQVLESKAKHARRGFTHA